VVKIQVMQVAKLATCSCEVTQHLFHCSPHLSITTYAFIQDAKKYFLLWSTNVIPFSSYVDNAGLTKTNAAEYSWYFLKSLIYSHTSLLTPWSRVLLEKLTGSQLVK